MVSARQPLKALVVCHAGVGVGLGHLTRSRVVARALREELAADVHLLVQGETVVLANTDAFTHSFVPITARLVDAIAAWVRVEAPLLVVFDLYPKQVPLNMDDLLVDLRASGCKLIAVDVLANLSRFFDLVFIPSFQFKPPPQNTDVVKFVFGWDCFLLNVSKPERLWQPGRNVLVLTGGSDASGLGDTWPSQLNSELPADTITHWVTGPFSRMPVWPARLRTEMHNHVAPENLNALMARANYAVTVYGVSFYELLCCGIPTVVFSPYGNKDNLELNAIEASGVAVVAIDERDAINKLVRIMESHEIAQALSERAAKLMGISGGQTFARFANELIQGHNLNG